MAEPRVQDVCSKSEVWVVDTPVINDNCKKVFQTRFVYSSKVNPIFMHIDALLASKVRKYKNKQSNRNVVKSKTVWGTIVLSVLGVVMN